VIENTRTTAKNATFVGFAGDPLRELKAGRRRRSLQLAVLAAIGLLILCRHAGRWLVVDHPEKSDAILVLAGETDRRITRGLQLLDQGEGRSLIIDVPAGARVYGFTETDLAERYIHNLPESASIRICPIQGLSTKAESRDVEKCLAASEHRVLIVTSEFHTRRALSTLRHEVHGRYFSIAAAYDDTQFGVDWWKHRQWAKTCVDEWLRLIWWYAVDRWRD
jgi:hypothetical protein